MKRRRWMWGCLGAMVGAAGIGVFYFVSETNSPQWIGVAYPESLSSEQETPAVPDANVDEPAPPASGNQGSVLSGVERNSTDVDLTKKETAAQTSGEVAMSTGFASSSTQRQPAADAQVSVDPKLQNSDALAPPPRKNVSDRTVVSQLTSVDQVTSGDSRLPELTNVGSSKDNSAPLETVTSPTELGITGSALHGNPLFKEPVTGSIPIGR